MTDTALKVQKQETRPSRELICSICGAQTEVFCEIQSMPACCNILFPTRKAALASEQARIQLAFCRVCGYIYNAAFDPERIRYDSSYDNSLHFSSRFQEYVQELASRLIDRFALCGKTIIEIGCGNAEFLSMICERGPNRGIGLDPSFIPGRADINTGLGIQIVKDSYSEHYRDLRCDLLCGRHVLEHAADPRVMIGEIYRALRRNQGAAVYFEVPNVLFTLRHNGVWDIIYEHVSYFAPQPLYRLFVNTGFVVREVRESFGGQYLSLEGIVTGSGAPCSPPPEDISQLATDVAVFSRERSRLLNHWAAVLDQIKRKGQRAIVWSAGAKGTIFLNTLCRDGSIEHVVDVNPHKQGKFVPGTGQEIIAPEALQQLKPEVLILMNPMYRDEIQKTVADLDVTPQFLSV